MRNGTSSAPPPTSTDLFIPEIPAGLVAWGYISVFELPVGDELVGSDINIKAVGKVDPRRRVDIFKAFWCAWWTERPHPEVWMPPDDFGIIEGPNAHSEAVGEADHIIRQARGYFAYVRSVGDGFARLAYTDGARRKTSPLVVLRRRALDAFAFFGLTPNATKAQVRRAYRKMVIAQKLHPDQGGDPLKFHDVTERMEAAFAQAQLNEAEGVRAAGKAKPAKKARSRAPRAPKAPAATT